MTRAEIEAEIADKLDRTDLSTSISRWFAKAHATIQRRLNFHCMSATVETTLVTGMLRTAAPDDFKEIEICYACEIDGTLIDFYLERSIADIRLRRSTDHILEDFDHGLFAIWANNVEIWPAAAASLDGKRFRLDYWRLLQPPLSSQSDWFTTHAFDYLEYRALMESAPHLSADARLKTWGDLALMAFNELVPLSATNRGGALIMRG